LRCWAVEVEGKAQFAVEVFANALESIPLILAENGKKKKQ
jgi:chaperonin GroEL (HSP60 family)